MLHARALPSCLVLVLATTAAVADDSPAALLAASERALVEGPGFECSAFVRVRRGPGEPGSFRITVAAGGARLRCVAARRPPGQSEFTAFRALVCDGERIRWSNLGETLLASAPSRLAGDAVRTFAREGAWALAERLRFPPGEAPSGGPRIYEPRLRRMTQEGRDLVVLDYLLVRSVTEGDERQVAEVTLWLDPATALPLRRTVQVLHAGGEGLRIEEEYVHGERQLGPRVGEPSSELFDTAIPIEGAERAPR